MSEERWLTAEQLVQARGEARVMPYLWALQETMSDIAKALYVNKSALVLVLPESEWADVPAEERAVMLLGCKVVHADVAAPMVAVKARRVLRLDEAGGTKP